jgi:HAD superfamily phosphoserine phosphatase-like hydrolase
MKKNNIKLAAFDVDGTLSTGVIGMTLIDELVKRGLFGTKDLASLKALEDGYALGKLGREEMSEQWLATYLKAVEGRDSEQYIEIGKKVWEKARANTFSFVKPLLEKLEEQNYTTLVISASADEIVRFFCEAHNLSPDRFRATKIKVDDQGKYVSEPEIIMSLAKHKLVQLNDLAQSLYPDQEINWKQSLAMGDSYSDFEMLNATGKPVVMKESNREENDLVQIAKEKGWTIVDENDALDKILSLIQ